TGHYPDLVARVLSRTTGPQTPRWKVSDIFFKESNGNETYIEVKSPKPNKGQCVEIADRQLHIHAIRKSGPPKVRTYFAMAYNPYGDKKADYNHSFKRYLDMDRQVLLGAEFWDLVGGTGTYQEVLSIYREVGLEKGPEMIRQLGLSF
ncbi:MAG: TdeIII family type II restriction endonuclease, partial [Nitrospiria bacterium]